MSYFMKVVSNIGAVTLVLAEQANQEGAKKEAAILLRLANVMFDAMLELATPGRCKARQPGASPRPPARVRMSPRSGAAKVANPQ